jgi:hypothetical protein
MINDAGCTMQMHTPGESSKRMKSASEGSLSSERIADSDRIFPAPGEVMT